MQFLKEAGGADDKHKGRKSEIFHVLMLQDSRSLQWTGPRLLTHARNDIYSLS